ncbi:Transfer protein [Seminavis robusta]|uniref:Transfer protein n=1 Tax=Seminavis robusta TaxID=568900 RepID=A0A9N8ESF6_9STRA|nr:Transfer protein [Seminavis robusta]|eukprot:Sro1646_g288300.1 Transfer protein (303) ;mRNA; r:9707-10615
MTKTVSLCTEWTEPDIYGQVHPVETPALLDEAIEEFDRQVLVLLEEEEEDNTAKTVVHLRQAQEKCPELLTRDFKLMFLRCDCFRVPDAVKRFAKFWDMKVDFFGSTRAWQPISMDLLEEQDQVPLQQLKLVRLLPQKDPTGRQILFMQANRQHWDQMTPSSAARAVAYVVMAALQDDVVTQCKGLVVMMYLKGETSSQFNRKFIALLLQAIKGAIPVRLSAAHQIHPQIFLRLIWPMLKLLLDKRMMARLPIFAGDTEQVLAALSKYGYSKSMLPTEMGGDVELDDYFDEWLEQRRQIEGK